MIKWHECRYCGKTVTLPDTHYLQAVEQAIEDHYENCDPDDD